MLAFVFAAALMADATPKQPVSFKTPPAAESLRETVSDTARGPVLSAVAVTLECTARANGDVEGCHVLGETHPGLGFGDAAVALMRGEHVAPGPRDVQFAKTIQFMP